MKTITIEKKLYTFEELSKEVQNKLIEEYKEDTSVYETRNELFYDDVMECLKAQFPKSDLRVCYSLSCCQGDGLYITGNIDLYDMLEELKGNYNEKEIKTLKHYISMSYHAQTELEYESHYYYFDRKQNAINIQYDLEENIENYYYKNINYELIERFSNDAVECLWNLCDEFETEGYDILYNVEDEEAIEYYICNYDEEFTEDGEIFYA